MEQDSSSIHPSMKMGERLVLAVFFCPELFMSDRIITETKKACSEQIGQTLIVAGDCCAFITLHAVSLLLFCS